jgi:hypothetical protein
MVARGVHVTALWTVTVLVALLAVVDSIAVIALIRQVGLLHLRIGPPREPQLSSGQQPPQGLEPPRGPQPGSRLWLGPARDVLADGPAPDLVLLGFVRPTCDGCTVALPAFTSAASGLSGSERALLVSDADEARTRAYLAAHGVSLPLITGPHLLSVNRIPTIPFAIVADGAGNVLAAGAATAAEQLEAVISRARRARQSVTREAGDGTEQDTRDERHHV